MAFYLQIYGLATEFKPGFVLLFLHRVVPDMGFFILRVLFLRSCQHSTPLGDTFIQHIVVNKPKMQQIEVIAEMARPTGVTVPSGSKDGVLSNQAGFGIGPADVEKLPARQNGRVICQGQRFFLRNVGTTRSGSRAPSSIGQSDRPSKVSSKTGKPARSSTVGPTSKSATGS